MNDAPFSLWFETAVGTISVVGLVLGCSDLGPWLLRILLALFGTIGVAFTFYSIFEALEIQCYHTEYDPDDGPGGGGPDEGERVPDFSAVHATDGLGNVVKLKRAA